MVAKLLLLIVLAASGVACGRNGSSVHPNTTEPAGTVSEVSCTSSPEEGLSVAQSRSFDRFDATLSPAGPEQRPAIDGTDALATAKSLGMFPSEKADCTEILFGLFSDNKNGPTELPAWAIVVHTKKPWTMDVAHYWKECALRGATCPTPSVTEREYSFQTVVVIDAQTKKFVRHMEIPMEE